MCFSLGLVVKKKKLLPVGYLTIFDVAEKKSYFDMVTFAGTKEQFLQDLQASILQVQQKFKVECLEAEHDLVQRYIKSTINIFISFWIRKFLSNFNLSCCNVQLKRGER